MEVTWYNPLFVLEVTVREEQGSEHWLLSPATNVIFNKYSCQSFWQEGPLL